jgi:GT2 family glycosyltransferase
MTNPKLSIIIPAYGNLAQVLRCKRSIEDTTDPALTEVLIQDDASPDYNGEITFGKKVCQRNDFNLGFAGNCNRGVKRAKGVVYMLVNQDVYMDETQTGWDKRLLDVFDQYPQVGIIGPTLLFPDGRVQSVGGGFDIAKQPFHWHLGASNPDWQPIATPRRVGWITGAAFAVRAQVWHNLGGFDTAYGRGYFEDVDFCVMAQYHLNAHVWHEPSIRFTHEAGSTGGNPAFAKNALLFKRRWVDIHTEVITPDVQVKKVSYWA